MWEWLFALVFVGVAIVLGYLPSRLMRRKYAAIQPADTRALASDVMARIGVLHGLILSLMFASAHGEAQRFVDGVQAEAAAATHVYFNAVRYKAPGLEAAIQAYVVAAIEKDWPQLLDQRALSNEGWVAWRQVLNASLELRPADRGQQVLADRIQADIWLIQDLRQIRGLQAINQLSVLFWLISVVGLVLVATLLFVHEINPLHQRLMAMYSLFTGLTLYMIFDLSHPFQGLLTISPSSFQDALSTIRSGY